MPQSWFLELGRYIGVEERHASTLRALRPAIEPRFPSVVDEFYERILANEGTRRILFEGDSQVEKLKGSLLEWLRTLFTGPYDEAYWGRRARIAETHARIGLPIPYVVGAMNLIRTRLTFWARRATQGDVARQDEALDAIQRVLDLELGVMLEGYQARRLEATVAVHRAEVAAIDDAARRVSGERTLSEILGQALTDLRARTGAEMGGLFVLVDEELRLAASHGLPPSFPAPVRKKEEGGAWEFLSREGIRTGLPGPGTGARGGHGNEGEAGSALSMPVVRDGRWFGTILLASPEAERFREESLPFLRAMASQIGIGIEYLLLYERLRASEAHFRAIVETAPEYIWTMRRDGRATYLNRGFLGIPREELLSGGLPGTRDLFIDGTLARFEEALASVFARGEGVLGIRVRLRPRDGGEPRFFLGNLAPLPGSEGAVEEVLGVFRDVTEEERLRDDLVRSERLAAVGEMAATIAHEVRNPLAAAKGVLEILAERFPPESEERSVIGDTVARFETLSRLIADLLLFSRPIDPQRRRTEASALLRDLAEGLRREESLQGMEIREHQGERLGAIAVDDILVYMAILNLANNAAQAMGGKGEILLRAERVGDRVAIRVEDRGPGIPPAIRGRLFTPFASTKSRGTGLGLATVKRIAESHGGSAYAEDRLGGGAIFSILFPSVGR
ncbi:MAG TPA: protoglobin domain-containing protein [Planctomycetota bacterium]|nr:protoglobin domain-containing protein [Planctomycetota bacterium]